MSGHRDWGGSSEEHQPVTWWNGHAVYAVHLIAIVLVASMIATAVHDWRSATWMDDWLAFGATAVLRGQVWRIATYGLVNRPDIQFALDMVMLVWFGREVERFIGRNPFLILFAACYLVTPIVLTAIGPWSPHGLEGKIGGLAIFIAFALLYPSVPVFFGLAAKWAALILLGIYTMMAMADRNAVLLISIWASCGTAYALIRVFRGEFSLPKVRLPRSKPALRVLPDLKPASEPDQTDVDAILDKIATSGLGSLTAKERARLEAAGRKRQSPPPTR